jgi:diguanylate cyclase (GGDEF)-like protein/PAS domain S-box-containing protein
MTHGRKLAINRGRCGTDVPAVEVERGARFGGRLSAALYLLCGALLTVAIPFIPLSRDANRAAMWSIGWAALATGGVIWLLPWHRWRRETTLWLFLPTFALIGVHNQFAGVDGYIYAPFFFITFAWTGLVHRRGTAVAIAPFAAATYLLPLHFAGHWNAASAASIVYVLPGGVLLGEAISWVSDRLRATQRSLTEREASFRKLFLENPQPMWLYDQTTLAFVEVNTAAIKHYGYTRDEFLAMSVVDIRPDDDVTDFLDALVASHRRQRTNASCHVLKDGRQIDVDVTAHPLEFAGRDVVLVSVQDVTERNRLEEELRHQAFHDSLTQLANRSLFSDRVRHALDRDACGTAPLAVLVLDLDGFKTVNDSLGHNAGDALLVKVGERLRDHLRSSDTAARLGGDEFAVLFEDAPDMNIVAARAEQLLQSLKEPFDIAGKHLVLSASVGVAANRPGDGPEELIRNADIAMYMAKRQGKACVQRFEDAMHDAVLERLELDAELRRALKHDEFLVYYQPTVDLSTGEVSGLEALVRWQHPTRGLLGPLEFIPLAEETGLIVELGRWVLREACHQAARWQLVHGAPKLAVAVNLSPRQLRDPRLVRDVAATLAASHLAPGNLILEITEGVLLDDTDTALASLHELKALGVRLAIDDFGTGYSSLSYLRTLPIDIVKIDKAFVDGVATHAESAGLIEAILRMADTLELETVAEGVETIEQLRELTRLGTQVAQGYYYSKPLPEGAVTGFLAQYATVMQAANPLP